MIRLPYTVRQEKITMSQFKNKTIFIIFLFIINSSLFGQTGYISIPDSGWQIIIDDTLQFSTQSLLIALPVGNHSISLQPVNNKNWMATTQNRDFYLQDGDTVLITATRPKFNRDYLLRNIIDQNDVSTNKLTLDKKYNERKYFRPAILTTAIVANWASFYIKRKADDYYDVYSETSNLERMEKYYNRAADYDVYANILLGISATALTVYFYYLITD